MICRACATAADTRTPAGHDRCEDNATCTCEHQPVKEESQ